MRNELAGVIVDGLRQRGETLSVAESLTGGGLGARITSAAGSSDVFLGGVIAYDQAVKVALLKISQLTIEEFGVVSEEVANAMAQGALNLFHSTWAIGTTGVAGPGPSEGVEPGTVWISIRGPVNQTTLLAIQGEREEVRNACLTSALTTFSRILAL